jgi:hypothetical protein
MRRREVLLIIALTVVAGVVGGALSNRVFMARTAAAQEAEQQRKVITAEEFRLVDEDGKIRAVLVAGSKGDISINFYDRYDENRATLGLSSEGQPVLKLFDQGSLEFADKNGQIRVRVDVAYDGSPSLRLYDEDGRSRAALGCVSLETADTARTGSVEKRAESSLVLSDKQGKVMWSAP